MRCLLLCRDTEIYRSHSSFTVPFCVLPSSTRQASAFPPAPAQHGSTPSLGVRCPLEPPAGRRRRAGGQCAEGGEEDDDDDEDEDDEEGEDEENKEDEDQDEDGED